MIDTSTTYTPKLTREVLDGLEDYANVYCDDFSHQKQVAATAATGATNSLGDDCQAGAR